MKALLALALVFSSSAALASDRLNDEIICNKVTAPGEADNGLTLVLQSNPTAWAKKVVVIESGYVGPRNIANIQVPLNPTVRLDSSGFISEDVLTYEGKGLVLEIRVLRIEGRPLNGGQAKLALPDYEPENVTLTCDYAK